MRFKFISDIVKFATGRISNLEQQYDADNPNNTSGYTSKVSNSTLKKYMGLITAMMSKWYIMIIIPTIITTYYFFNFLASSSKFQGVIETISYGFDQIQCYSQVCFPQLDIGMKYFMDCFGKICIPPSSN